MKVKKLKFENHKVLGDLEIDFTDETGKPLDTIVFIGDNGTGKTQVLESIVNLLESHPYTEDPDVKKEISNGMATLTLEDFDTVKTSISWEGFPRHMSDLRSSFSYGSLKAKSPRLVWIPAELNIEQNMRKEMSMDERIERKSIKLIESASQWHFENVIDYVVEIIDNEVYGGTHATTDEAIEVACQEINQIFNVLDLKLKLKGVTPRTKIPLFKTEFDHEFDIRELSSGEKQIFFRFLSLKRLNINNAIILIDEPETSLHPEWQRKIIDVYRNIGENNQIIMATHSPLIIGSVPSESVRIMSRDNEGKIKVNRAHQSYGQTVDYILNLLMGLKDLRDVDTARDLKAASQMLKENKFDDYGRLINTLKEQLGSTDKDIMRLEFEKAIKVKQNAKNN